MDHGVHGVQSPVCTSTTTPAAHPCPKIHQAISTLQGRRREIPRAETPTSVWALCWLRYDGWRGLLGVSSVRQFLEGEWRGITPVRANKLGTFCMEHSYKRYKISEPQMLYGVFLMCFLDLYINYLGLILLVERSGHIYITYCAFRGLREMNV